MCSSWHQLIGSVLPSDQYNPCSTQHFTCLCFLHIFSLGLKFYSVWIYICFKCLELPYNLVEDLELGGGEGGHWISREEWVSSTAPQERGIQIFISCYGWCPVAQLIHALFNSSELMQLPGSNAFPKGPSCFSLTIDDCSPGGRRTFININQGKRRLLVSFKGDNVCESSFFNCKAVHKCKEFLPLF